MPQSELDVVTAAHLMRMGHTSRSISRLVSDGRLTRIRHGVYAPSDGWSRAPAVERQVAFIRATIAQPSASAVVSHLSAAALHRLPLMYDWPSRVHVLTPGAPGGSSSRLLIAHRAPRPPAALDVIDGVTVTDLTTTLVDVASTSAHETSVPMLDHALRGSGAQISERTRDRWVDQLRELAPSSGATRAFRAFAFATPLADSPGESLSRVLIAKGGFAEPTLQRRLEVGGRIYFADFAWDGVLGEYDGRDKYRDPSMLKGRSMEQAYRDEKRREDSIRLATGCRFVRWGAEEVFHPQTLWKLLRDGGVPRGT